MRISYVNFSDDSTLIASSEQVSFPSTNLQKQHLIETWRSSNVFQSIIEIDAGQDEGGDIHIQPDVVFLAYTNITDNAEVRIQANNINSWDNPSLDLEMNRYYNRNIKKNTFFTYHESLDDVGYRYWRIIIIDVTNPDGYIEAGRLWAGDAVDLSGPFISFEEENIDTSLTSISKSGQSYSDLNYAYKQWEMSFPYWNQEEKEAMEDFFSVTKKSEPFFVSYTDPNECTDYGPFYVIQTNDFNFVHLKTLNLWSSRLVLREVF